MANKIIQNENALHDIQKDIAAVQQKDKANQDDMVKVAKVRVHLKEHALATNRLTSLKQVISLADISYEEDEDIDDSLLEEDISQEKTPVEVKKAIEIKSERSFDAVEKVMNDLSGVKMNYTTKELV